MLLRSFSGSRYSCCRFLSGVASNKLEVFVNDIQVFVDPGTTIIQAAKLAGVHIPRFCYHEKLSVAGNCRMCLVEIEKMPKPMAACAMPVANGWRIKTDSEVARKARESIMEFLLINHPLDCPICDQGGECDLQDQAMNYGNDRSRFIDNSFMGKRAVEDKDLGPLIKTIMTRCIHCTRCVRFACEIAGIENLGTTGRGNEMQIGTYVSQPLLSEISGNLIDVCPVGALTSKPTEFTTRPWEMRKVETIDTSDAVGSNIVVGTRGGQIMKVLPRPNEEINEDWISDKARFSFDGLKNQRLLVPMLRSPEGSLEEASWQGCLFALAKQWASCKPDEIFGLVGNESDIESMVVMRDFFYNNNVENLYMADKHFSFLKSGLDFRCTYTMNNHIQGIESADVILMIGVCPRYEAAMINARIRKSWMHNCLKVGYIGKNVDVNFPANFLGNEIKDIKDIIEGKHKFSEVLFGAKNPLILLGTAISEHSSGSQIHTMALNLANTLQTKISDETWKVFNYIQRAAGYTGALDLGILPLDDFTKLKKAKLVYILSSDPPVSLLQNIPQETFIVYQGHHGDTGAPRSNMILPGTSFMEKNGLYVNTEGRTQNARKVIGPPNLCKEDWAIIRACSELIGEPLPYNTIEEVRKRAAEIAPHLGVFDTVEESSFLETAAQYNQSDEKLVDEVIEPKISKLADFYMTDVIGKSSPTMAKCTVLARKTLASPTEANI